MTQLSVTPPNLNIVHRVIAVTGIKAAVRELYVLARVIAQVMAFVICWFSIQSCSATFTSVVTWQKRQLLASTEIVS